ncbi:hypothetical protein SARC_03203 [Sphaeroforma arctica JP610]|uniref:Uncharacterized protein n=1 Tax=Sphaeroforma arctica JP610 TaxID=667725 RepID=A0A0L0G6N9_9EUKA|nr:hypothetical protein SARC_03203 [Sphaeroforma arctica JP610]KNC84584.1 hypothetical protein SARC_03203 [Sphaeroforma arctica JP610]|eukprot:XP_014158486.1 hypothetical protein SARC_03203 [Sphaeroforma arctica JP610]
MVKCMNRLYLSQKSIKKAKTNCARRHRAENLQRSANGELTDYNRNWVDVSLMKGDELKRELGERYGCTSSGIAVARLRNKLVIARDLGTSWAFVLDASGPHINYLLDNRAVEYNKRDLVGDRRDLLLAEIRSNNDIRYLTAEGGVVAPQEEYDNIA